MKKLAENGQTE